MTSNISKTGKIKREKVHCIPPRKSNPGSGILVDREVCRNCKVGKKGCYQKTKEK